jgi:hypothetical protein
MKTPLLTALCALTILSRPLAAHDANQEMANAASALIAALNSDQKAKAAFEFQDAQRSDWHFIPRPRKGLPIKEMTHEQRLLAHALLSTGLSHSGYGKAVSIMSLEAVLAELEKTRVGGPARDPELYFVSIFGTPGGATPWGWRMEGHHLSLNFTVAGDESPSMTPSFFGTNPGEIRQGPRAGLRVLAKEEELGRALVKSLNDSQRKTAILSAEAPKDILNDPKRNDPTQPEGLSQELMTPDQKAILQRLIREYLGRHRTDVASEEWAKLEKLGPEKIHFAWAGGLEKGQPHYYRVQAGRFVLEYDNTQNDANHVHSMWRDFDHDFGADLLKAHYQKAHSK